MTRDRWEVSSIVSAKRVGVLQLIVQWELTDRFGLTNTIRTDEAMYEETPPHMSLVIGIVCGGHNVFL